MLWSPTTMEPVTSPWRTPPKIQVESARFSSRPGFIPYNKARGAKARGLRYEASIVKWLDEEFSGSWDTFPGQWLSYTNSFGVDHYCQPDWFAVNFDRWEVLIVEVKLTRVSKAWWQLNELYKPVLKKMFSAFDFACLEIASKVVPVDVPEKVRVIHRLGDYNLNTTSFMKVKELERLR